MKKIKINPENPFGILQPEAEIRKRLKNIKEQYGDELSSAEVILKSRIKLLTKRMNKLLEKCIDDDLGNYIRQDIRQINDDLLILTEIEILDWVLRENNE